jgi:YfiH family protein
MSPSPGTVPLVQHEDWRLRFPWLLQGTTTRTPTEDWDFRLYGPSPAGEVLDRWEQLQEDTSMPAAVHAHQVHGARLMSHVGAEPGLRLLRGFDGHFTGTPGVLLTVSVADCVPVFLVDPARKCVGVVHAGWKGVAARILDEALSGMRTWFGSSPRDVHVHLGPSICGRCYEVGPEVHEAVGLQRPEAPEPVDLRLLLARQGERAGIPGDQISRSGYCTRCDAALFHSHRGGSSGRQLGILGIRRRTDRGA